jgi:hypothetical protein
LKVNLLPFKVNLSASPPIISNVALPLLTASVITLLVFSGVKTLFVVEIIAGNSNNFFKISPTGKIQVAEAGLNYESKQNYILTVKITDDDG